MEITFLGTGAAFSPDAYNASILIDRTILLDAGAPLTVHLPKAGVSLDDPRAVLLSHFHADHTFGLAGLMLGRVLHNETTPPLRIFGPVGTTAYLQQLLDLAWGEDMRRLSWDRLQLRIDELNGGDRFEVDGSPATAFKMRHTSRLNCLGYTIERDGSRLGYTGDAEMSDQLEALVASSDHVISEMTYGEHPGAMHLARRDIEALMQQHPQTRFLLTHRGESNGEVRGAVMARDFQTVRLPLR
ncbi:MAG TPA: ribonuclease Z [Candidatus Dormibacteraeota bacterium]|nr:ribonuclease Z [Candidatus Dormibacteraeota bacterium]